MVTAIQVKEVGIYDRIRVMSNGPRFKILELTQEKQLSVTELSSMLKLAYTRCSDYIKILENYGLITKTKEGKNVRISSKVKISKNGIEFS